MHIPSVKTYEVSETPCRDRWTPGQQTSSCPHSSCLAGPRKSHSNKLPWTQVLLGFQMVFGDSNLCIPSCCPLASAGPGLKASTLRWGTSVLDRSPLTCPLLPTTRGKCTVVEEMVYEAHYDFLMSPPIAKIRHSLRQRTLNYLSSLCRWLQFHLNWLQVIFSLQN